MLSTNNTVTNTTQKEKKYSLSTVLAWLYLKTIGRILPGRWNKWAENILHHNQVIVDNGVQTEIMSKNKTTQTKYDKIEGKNFQASSEFEGKKELEDKNKELNEELEGVNQALETFIGPCNNQAQQIKDLELESNVLKEEKEQLNSIIKELEKNYRELAEIAQKRGEEFLVQFKGKSEEILNLQKELIECSKEFANKTEILSVEIEKKDGKIGRLTQLNEVLEQEKKEMETKNNEQKQVISDLEKRIKEQNDLINSFRENKDINETVKKDNESLRAQNTELKSKFSKLNNESDTKIKQLENQLKEKQAEFTQAKKKNTELEDLKKCLEKDKSDLEGKLHAAEEKKKELEDEINELKEQVQALEESKEWESAGIDDSLKQTHLNLIEMLKKELAKKEKQIEQLQEKQKQVEDQLKADIKKLQGEKENMEEQLRIIQQQLLNNQEQQKLEEKLKDVDKRLEDIDGEIQKSQGQAKTKELDVISIASNANKTLLSSLKSGLSNGSYELFSSKNLKNFLSNKNTELKKNFPEFEKKHFCHNVLGETVKSLSNQNDGKFESNKLLELLESNLTRSARDIIEAEVKEVVKKHCDIGNIDKELRDGVLKDKLLPSIKKCMKKLSWDEKCAAVITDSVLQNFRSKNNSNLKEIALEELIKGRMKFFSSNIELSQLASSIRDKFLSPDQGMCNQTQEGVNEYQLTEEAKKEYKLNEVNHMPNSSMSHTNSTPVSVKQEAKSR